MARSSEQSARPTVAVVLAGGGARGAYEMGALSALLPYLDARGERPRVIVGTSVGALNAAYLASTAQEPVSNVVAAGERLWSEINFDDVLRPLLSGAELARALGSVGEFLRVPGARLWSLLDPAPLAATLRARIRVGRIHGNVKRRDLHAAAVVATSARLGATVVFHDGGGRVPLDRERAIEYVQTRIGLDHVRASAAIPGVFPAVKVSRPAAAAGWYFDGGTRLNTPIKPALALGADRVVVIALNSLRSASVRGRPQALDGASELTQAVLVDPLVHDVQTLATINSILAHRDGDGASAGIGARRGAGAGKAAVPASSRARGARTGLHKRVPYIFIAPERPQEIGAIAAHVYRERFAGLRDAVSSPSLALLGRAFAAGDSPARGELFSYLFFAREFAEALMLRGRADAERWLSRRHDDGPWRLRKPAAR
ncbi:MAG TPA: patatin-like phospholipase family protein [Solirubrobacteraceae bacterium]|jgi:NTE family protein|nr:patatin-like phospholipase family protein [Solirubrobacteraceae bacterium]